MKQYSKDAFLPATVSPIVQLFAESGDAFRNAAGLLAGHQGRRLVGDIISAMLDQGELSPPTIKRLRRLFDVLSLKNVGDPYSDEASYFAEIDPASPQVEEICLLTDALSSAMAAHGFH